MDIGFTGQVVIVLKKPIDGEEPTRLIVNIERVNEIGVTVTYEDNDDDSHTYFIPFSNICAIEEWTEEEEAEETEHSEPAPIEPSTGMSGPI